MGNTQLHIEREQAGEEIFSIAEHMYPDCAGEITGIVLDTDDDDLRALIRGDHRELYKRIRQAAQALKQTSDTVESIPPFESSNGNHVLKHKLLTLLQGRYSFDESEIICSQLMKMEALQRDKLLSSEKLLAEFISTQLTKRKAVVPEQLQNVEDDIRVPSERESAPVNEEQMHLMLADRLYQQLYNIHPNIADRLCGIMLELRSDILLHVVDSDAWLFKYLAQTMGEMTQRGSLTNSELVALKDDLGELLYQRLSMFYPNESEDAFPQVTGMLLDAELTVIYDMLGNEKKFKEMAEIAFDALEESCRS